MVTAATDGLGLGGNWGCEWWTVSVTDEVADSDAHQQECGAKYHERTFLSAFEEELIYDTIVCDYYQVLRCLQAAAGAAIIALALNL
jgi:hypothetical protein